MQLPPRLSDEEIDELVDENLQNSPGRYGAQNHLRQLIQVIEDTIIVWDRTTGQHRILDIYDLPDELDDTDNYRVQSTVRCMKWSYNPEHDTIRL